VIDKEQEHNLVRLSDEHNLERGMPGNVNDVGIIKVPEPGNPVFFRIRAGHRNLLKNLVGVDRLPVPPAAAEPALIGRVVLREYTLMLGIIVAG